MYSKSEVQESLTRRFDFLTKRIASNPNHSFDRAERSALMVVLELLDQCGEMRYNSAKQTVLLKAIERRE